MTTATPPSAATFAHALTLARHEALAVLRAVMRLTTNDEVDDAPAPTRDARLAACAVLRLPIPDADAAPELESHPNPSPQARPQPAAAPLPAPAAPNRPAAASTDDSLPRRHPHAGRPAADPAPLIRRTPRSVGRSAGSLIGRAGAAPPSSAKPRPSKPPLPP